MGRAYVVCRPCRRFVGVGAWLDKLDTRAVTFSCSVCGGHGELTVEHPGKEGLQHDPRANPARPPQVAARLSRMQALARSSGRHPPVVRERLPQSERTKFVPEPRYRLRPMPFATFGELAPLGLVLEVWCSSCKSSRPVTIGNSLRERRFGRARFACTAARYDGTICRGLGHPHIVPMTGSSLPQRSRASIVRSASALECQPCRLYSTALEQCANRHGVGALPVPGLWEPGSGYLSWSPSAWPRYYEPL